MSTPSDEKPIRHVSELADPRQRFLARIVDHTLDDGWRSSEDFLRHFPPATIIESLSGASELRVKLIVATTGTHEKIALKKSAGSATEDLELALAEKTTTPAALVSLFPPDDKVRYLDPKKLWAFVVEDEFYKVSSDSTTRRARAAERLGYIIDCALSEGLLTLSDVTDGMTFDEIAASLPVADLRDVVKHALQIARAGAPLTEDRFMAVVPLPALVSHVPLDHTWDRVVVQRVAVPAGFVAEPSAAEPRDAAASVSSAAESVPKVDEPPPAPPPKMEAQAAPVASEPSRVPDEDEVRRRVIERLRVIDRLPPSNGDISTPVLLSIESMYADLWAVSDDDEREASIRESFPNEMLLRTAMLAMIELLDPSVDTRDPIIRDADVSGLIKIVLFEERRRRDSGPSSPRKASGGGSPASQSRARRSVPPPLPRSSTPPPLPPPVETSGRPSSPPPLPAEATSGKRDHR